MEKILNIFGDYPDSEQTGTFYDFDINFQPESDIPDQRVFISLRTNEGETYALIRDNSLRQIRDAIDAFLSHSHFAGTLK